MRQVCYAAAIGLALAVGSADAAVYSLDDAGGWNSDWFDQADADSIVVEIVNETGDVAEYEHPLAPQTVEQIVEQTVVSDVAAYIIADTRVVRKVYHRRREGRPPPAVPLPAAAPMMAFGLAGLAALRRRKRAV